MSNLRETATDLMTTVEFAIKSGDWKVDGACDPTVDIIRLKNTLAQLEQEPVAWMTPTGALYRTEDVSCFDDSHTPLYTQPVDTVNTLQKRVDETAKREHEPVAWVLYYNNEHGTPMRETFYAEAHMEFHKSHNETQRGLKCHVVPLYTSPPKREWVGLTDDEKQFFKAMGFSGIDIVEAKLKEKNT